MTLVNFIPFKTALGKQFRAMNDHGLFRTNVPGDALWERYLATFPEGTNPMYRKRTEHDCSCCRHFIRSVGNLVTIVNGELTSIWDCGVTDPTYAAVAAELSMLAKSGPIENRFLTSQAVIGTDRNHEDGPNGVLTWDHFVVTVPNALVVSKDRLATLLGEFNARHDVFSRGLTELKLDAIDSVLELIAQNSLYRGEEQQGVLTAFRDIKRKFDALSPERQALFSWSELRELSGAVSHVRNTAIGTLLIDLSAGTELENAVNKFERSIMAPANYKRPTALVSRAMIEKAKETVESLGLTSALERRFAALTDLSVNNVLFADANARPALTGSVFDDLAKTATTRPRAFDRVEEVTIDKFLADVLPRASSLELFVENHHAGNFVSLVAPVDPHAGRLFKWDNPFSWSYVGDVADSMRVRVKKAGGNVEGDLCCRLGWFNYDDLDLHLKEPRGFEIFFANKRSTQTGGTLDVDMNAGSGRTREPVENIFYRQESTMQEGEYTLFVHQFHAREKIDMGFEVELDFKGTVHRFTCARAVKQNETVVVAKFRYTRGQGIDLLGNTLPKTTASRKIWNVATENFHKVSVAMLSPNHWDGHGVGNRHYFFMLDGCQNDGDARGFYNEFLKTELDPHRRVLELVGSKMRAESSTNQLSGLGFSSTLRNHVIARITGALTRTVRITF